MPTDIIVSFIRLAVLFIYTGLIGADWKYEEFLHHAEQ